MLSLNSCMRAYELLETDLIAQGIYDPAQDTIGQRQLSSTRKSTITLRDVHRLSKIRKARQREYEKKMALVSTMYGDGDNADDIDLERARLEHEKEMVKLELEKDKLAIQREIENAEIDHEQREKISKMALRTLTKKFD